MPIVVVSGPPCCVPTEEPPITPIQCVDVLPPCSYTERQEQRQYIYDLQLWAKNVLLDEIIFPIEMCKVTLCDGRQINIPLQYKDLHPFPGPHECEIIISPQEYPEDCIIKNPNFAMVLSYNNPNGSYSGAVPQYNGNISQIQQQVNKKHIEGINYRYDSVDRLVDQDYWWKSCKEQYWNNKFYNVENITYDLNGNMKTIKRRTKPLQSCDPNLGIIDNLSMSYSGNRLMSVSEGATMMPEMGYILGDHDGGYNYDSNGNMTKIGNNDSQVGYNFLNLPTTIGVDGLGFPTDVPSTPNWIYTANGTKLKEGDREYVDGIEYKNGELYAIHHAEGRIYADTQNPEQINSGEDKEWKHQFYIRDHLGSTRVVLDQSGAPIQEDSYYPFGMRQELIDDIQNTLKDTRFLYNGKEMNEELGMLDYGFRFYDPSICRFTGVDPIAADFAHASSYNYAENDPVGAIDLWGLQKVRFFLTPISVGSVSRTGLKMQNGQSFVRASAEVGAEQVAVIAAGGAAGASLAYLQSIGWAGTASLVANEVKDEVLSQATGGISDVADVTKMISKGIRNLPGLAEGLSGRASASDVISETNAGRGNITSESILTESQALDAGIDFVGGNAKELGKNGSGVFRSQTKNADGTVNQFRMDNNSIQGNHAPNVSHVHLEVINPNNKPKVNNHIPIIQD